MREYFRQTVQSAIIIWITLTIDILVTSILYLSLKSTGIPENINLVITILLIVTSLISISLFPRYLFNRAKANEIFQQKPSVQDPITKDQLQEILDELRASKYELQDKINTIEELRKYVELMEIVTKSVGDTNNALLYLILGNQLVEQKKIVEACKAYEKVKAWQPKDPQVNYILGRAYRNIGYYDQAITCLTISVESDPSFAQAHFELGIAYRDRANKLYSAPDDEMRRDEEYEKAIDQVKLALRLQPNDEDILSTLGSISRQAKDYKRALMYYKQVSNVDPNSSYAVGNIAILTWHEGIRASSLEAFRHTEELATKRIDSGISDEPFWDYYDRATARLVLGNKDAALSDYRTAIHLTHNLEPLRAVLDNIKFLKEVEDKYPLDGLDEALKLLMEVSFNAEEGIAGSYRSQYISDAEPN
jgi:tetratricopeptide (TPR) repeat protein